MTEKQKHERDLRKRSLKAWYGVDLDGTLAEYHGWGGPIGPPVHKMLERVYKWIADGRTVKIFTARADDPDMLPEIKEWLKPLGLDHLEITNVKDLAMIELWDDRCVQVIPNTGERADGKWQRDHQDEKK